MSQNSLEMGGPFWDHFHWLPKLKKKLKNYQYENHALYYWLVWIISSGMGKVCCMYLTIMSNGVPPSAMFTTIYEAHQGGGVLAPCSLIIFDLSPYFSTFSLLPDCDPLVSFIYIVASHLPRGSVVTVAGGQIRWRARCCGRPTMQGASNLRGESAQDFVHLAVRVQKEQLHDRTVREDRTLEHICGNDRLLYT